MVVRGDGSSSYVWPHIRKATAAEDDHEMDRLVFDAGAMPKGSASLLLWPRRSSAWGHLGCSEDRKISPGEE